MERLNKLLQSDIQEFISNHITSDCNALALQKNPFDTFDYVAIINQIASKQKAKNKLPTWFASKNILYPSKVSIEQTSSEIAAKYKASIISGNSLIDLSGGFGVDAYYFANSFEQVIHCEINADLSAIVDHNFRQLNKSNIKCMQGESSEILKNQNKTFEYIYIDPSRRNDVKGKVFLLKDCEPNVPELLPFYFNYTNSVLIKTAPILDIQAGIIELKYVKNIHIVAINNKVKELLWEIEKGYSNPINIIAVNLDTTHSSIVTTEFNKEYSTTFSLPKKYLYEPNAALLKTGNFNAIAEIFKVDKLQQHSHLYTSNELVDFPGRSFIVNQVVPYQKNEIKNFITNSKMNVSTRNFPLKPDDLKKKHKIKDGGTIFAFFTTDIENNKIVLLCSKIK